MTFFYYKHRRKNAAKRRSEKVYTVIVHKDGNTVAFEHYKTEKAASDAVKSYNEGGILNAYIK